MDTPNGQTAFRAMENFNEQPETKRMLL